MSIGIYNILTLFSDLIILLIILVYLFKKKFTISYNNEKKYLYLFIILSFFSSLFYYDFFSSYLIKIWVLCRYIFIYFIVKNIFDKNEYVKFEKYFIFIFISQIFIGVIQFFDIAFLVDFFNPRSDLSKDSNWFLKGEDGIAGTFTFTVHYGYFMFAFSSFILFTNINNRNKILLLLLSTFFSLLSDSSISFLVSLIILCRYLILIYPKLFYNIILTFGSLFIFLFYDVLNESIKPLANIFNLFSEQWIIDQLRFSRLGVLQLFPLFFSKADISVILFGFSLDEINITQFINNSLGNNVPHVLRNYPMIGIEDVYWVAHLLYFGVIGLLLFLFFFKKIVLSFKKYSIYNPNFYKLMRLYIILVLLTAFVNQVFSFKTFVIYFFITISYVEFQMKTKI